MIVEDWTNETYHAHEGISKSGLDLISRSPAHYRYRTFKEPSRAMEIGTAIHTAVLEPDRFFTDYMLLRDVEDRRASAYKEAVKVYGSERVLTGPEADKVAGMQESVLGNPHAQALLTHEDSKKELSIVTEDPETGVVVKCRFDLLTGLKSLDLKKTQDARPDVFAKSVANYRYMVQAAFYSDLYFWETGDKLEAFGFLCVEEELPHANAIYVLDDDAIEFGRKLYRKDLNQYAECKESNIWPSIDSTPQILSLPQWAMRGNYETV